MSMRIRMRGLTSRLAPLVANLPSLAANLIIAGLAAIVMFFMVRASIDYFYQPIFGNPKALPESEASIDPKLLKAIERRIEESKRAQETPIDAPLPNPFD